MDLTIFMPFKPSKPSSFSYIPLAFSSLLSKILERISDFTLAKLRLYPILFLKFSREFHTHPYPFRLSHHQFQTL